MELSDKDLCAEILRRICRELSAHKVIIMFEAYCSYDLSGIAPSKAPDRTKSIMIQGEDINGDSYAIIQPFYRDKKGRIKLKDKIPLPKVSFQSRWSGILK